VGDVAGFGKTGPRLKLVVSDKELPLDGGKAQIASADSTSIRTVEDELQHFANRDAPETTGKEDLNLITKVRLRLPKDSEGLQNPSYTMQMEKKILEKKLGASDMHDLMRDGKRLEEDNRPRGISARRRHPCCVPCAWPTSGPISSGLSFWDAWWRCRCLRFLFSQ